MNNNQTGIWYSTWYSNEGRLIWLSGDGIGSKSQMLGDVTGDGKDDAITFRNGDWYVATSNGNGFENSKKWISGHGVGSSSQMIGDVNNDGKADAISFRNGDWYIATSNGNGFENSKKWISGHGVGSSSQIIGDVNGDSKDDAIFFKNGDWYVATSNGNGFENSKKWISGYGRDSSRQMIGDVTGDGKADAVTYFGETGNWYLAKSNGNSFDSITHWKTEHGNGTKHNQYRGSSWQGLGKISSEKDSFAPFVFYPEKGEWRVLPSEYSKPNILNTWEAWDIDYRPITNGSPQIYDSKDPAVIDEHLKQISDAGIDFLIFDLTNNIYVDEQYIFDRAKAVVDRIKIWNSDSNINKIKYSIAIGGVQFSNDIKTIENEAEIVWKEFVKYSGSENYHYLDGKPLLVSYSTDTQRKTWIKSDINKSDTQKFNLQWAAPIITGDKHDTSYFGWGFPEGSIIDDEVMVVMPGWDNKIGGFIPSRTVDGIEGGFYTSKGWDRVLEKNPDLVVINSFNEYSEHTAVAPAETNNLPASKQWSSPDLYWDITKEYNALYKGFPDSLEQLSNYIFQLDGTSSKSNKARLQTTITGINSNYINEIGVFVVDDADGKVNGIAPGQTGYTKAALSKAKVISSGISQNPNGFDIKGVRSLLEFDSGDKLKFFLVKNSTVDSVLADKTFTSEVIFASATTQKVTDFDNDAYILSWEDGSDNINDFNDLEVRIQATNIDLPLGMSNQGELLDLSEITTNVQAEFIVNREAALDNFVGFYEVVNSQGGIDTSGDGKADILPGQTGYTEAAISRRVSDINLTVNEGGTAISRANLKGNSLFAPFIIAGGRPDAILDNNPDNNPAVYFSFLGANPDKSDNIRLLGNNIWGFEDLPGGGDLDYNDMIVRVNLST